MSYFIVLYCIRILCSEQCEWLTGLNMRIIRRWGQKVTRFNLTEIWGAAHLAAFYTLHFALYAFHILHKIHFTIYTKYTLQFTQSTLYTIYTQINPQITMLLSTDYILNWTKFVCSGSEVAWYGMVWFGLVLYGMFLCGMVWYGLIWFCVVWFGMVLCGIVWYGSGSEVWQKGS